MSLRARSRSLLLAAGLAVACTSSAAQVAPASMKGICRDSMAALLPAESGSAKNVGTIVRASFTKTSLPRGDGQVAVVLTDVSAHLEKRYGTEDRRFDLAYFERQECWPREMWSGLFYCYELDTFGPPGGPALFNERTRAFLSVAAYLATGGASDAAAAQIASGQSKQVFIDGLIEQTSAPSHIDRWYYCQSCGNDRATLSEPVATAGMRFGRSKDTTYFISRSGWVARLRDGQRQASYAHCRAEGNSEE